MELLLVIAIIGILAGILLPALGGIRTRTRVETTEAQLQQIEIALEVYYADYDTYPRMGNDWLGGIYFATEDIGADLAAPFVWDNATKQWVSNGSDVGGTYSGPDADGTEMNYELDPGEDLGLDNIVDDPYDNGSGTPNAFSDNDGNLLEPSLGENNGRLDGTYYQRMEMFADEATGTLLDYWAAGDVYYHYYAGHVWGKTNTGMPEYRDYDSLADYKNTAPSYYNKWVLYSVGLDGRDHGLHNYYLVMQDGEDVGADSFASDPTDADGDFILFEPSKSIGENDDSDTSFTAGLTVMETGYSTPGGMSEAASPGGTPGQLDGVRGEPVFSYKVRKNRRREGAVYGMPDGDPVAYGVIMRFGP